MLLSVLMIVTSISVVFSITSLAAPIDDLRAALNAIPVSERTAFTITSTHGDSTGGNVTHNITDNTTNGTIYTAAVAFAAYFRSVISVGDGQTNTATAVTWWTKLYNNLPADIRASHEVLLRALCDLYSNNTRTNRGSPFTRDRNPGGQNSGVPDGGTHVTVNVIRTELQALRAYGDIASMPARVSVALDYGAKGGRQCTSSTSEGQRNHYFSSSVTINESSSSALSTKLKAIDNYFTPSRLAQNVMTFSNSKIQQEVTNNNAVMETLNSLSANEKNVFFGATKLQQIADYVTLCEEAAVIILYGLDVQYFHKVGGFLDIVNAGYDVEDLAFMDQLWTAQAYHYERLNALSGAQKAILAAKMGLDLPAIEAARVSLLYNLQYAQLRNMKATADELYTLYYRVDGNYRPYDDALMQHLYNTMTSYWAAINTIPQAYVNDVFTEGTSYITDFIASMEEEMHYRGIILLNNGHIMYYLGIANDDFSRISATKLIEKSEEAKARLATMQADLDLAQSILTPEDFANLYSGAMDQANAAIERLDNVVLAGRFAAQIDSAKDAYYSVGTISWDNFTLVKSMISMIEAEIYDYPASKAFISTAVENDYLWLKGAVLNEYNAFVRDGGYANFVQLQLEPYPTRDAMFEDLARTIGFEVTEENLLNVIQSLDKILTSEDFSNLTGMELSSCIGGLTSCMCSDEMVNCIVQLIYPAVAEALEDTWSELPTTYSVSGINISISVVPLHDVLASTASGNTISNLAVYPDLLARQLPSDFDAAKESLNAAVQGVNWVVTPTSPNTGVWSNIEDEDGKLTIDWGVDNPESPAMKAMTQSERFRYAMSNALRGIYPLLAALLLGQPYNSHANKVASMSGGAMVSSDPVWLDLNATGNNGYAKVLTPILEALNGTDLSAIPTVEQMRAYTDPSQLYDAIANPIHSFLNNLQTQPFEKIIELLPNIAHAMSFDKVAPLLNELSVGVVYTPNGKLGGLVGVACGNLIDVVDLSGAVDLNVGDLVLGDPESSPIDLSCTSDLNSFIQMLPSCLASSDDEEEEDDEGCTLSLPVINAGCLARLGRMDPTTPTKRAAGQGIPADGDIPAVPPACSGVRHYIYADKADVLYGILKYLLAGLRNDPNLLQSIMDLVSSDDDDDPDDPDDPGDPGDPGDPTCPWGDNCPLGDDCPCIAGNAQGTGNRFLLHSLGETLSTEADGDDSSSTLLDIIAIIAAEENEGNTIAALVELFNPVEYEKPEIQWREPDASASIPYLAYSNNWTTPTADYLYANIDDILADVLELLGEEGTVQDVINDALADVFTEDTIKSITDMLADLDLDDTILDLVASLGADLSVWSKYKTLPCPCVPQEDFYYYNFEDGDREAFLAAIYDIFDPVAPVLEFLLNGKDLVAFGGGLTFLGADGYADAIIPLLEALSCEAIMSPADYQSAIAGGDSTVVLSAILDPIFAKVDTLVQNPVSTIIDMIPNLLYFLSCDGLPTSLNVLLHPLFVILDTVRPIYSLGVADIIEMLGDDLPFELNITKVSDLTFGFLIDLIEELVGLDFGGPLNNVAENLVGYATPYTSANGKSAYRITEMSGGDVITALLSLVIQVLDDEDNVAALSDMLGEDVFTAIKNVLRLDEVEINMVSIDWLYQDKAGTGEVLNALNTSALFDYGYGTLWTKERAQYVNDNINTLADNFIYMLGINVDNHRVEDLDDLIASFLGVSLYTQDNAVAILDIFKGLVEEVDAISAGPHIKALLKETFGVDLNVWTEMNETSFSVADNDKQAFISALNQILAPLNPVLQWLLSDQDFAFFVDSEQNDSVVLPGAKGYEFGIIPILETLECENILTPEAFNADPDNMITNIVTPLLAKLDVILANPLEEILNILPALTYFINSKGLDASFKNLIHPVRMILSAIDPIATVNLYELLGFNLEEYDFEALAQLALDAVYESTGYNLTPIVMDAAAEMTLGVVVQKDSLSSMNNYKRFTMEYAGPERADMITILLRLGLTFLTNADNAEKIKAMVKENVDMSQTSYGYVSSMIDVIASSLRNPRAMDSVLGVVYYMIYGLSMGTSELRTLYDTVNGAWAAAFNMLKNSDSEVNVKFYQDAVRFLEKYLPGIVTPEGPMAPNGFIAFFQKIAEFFQKIMDFFAGLFGG
jgi:hypothetical protein